MDDEEEGFFGDKLKNRGRTSWDTRGRPGIMRMKLPAGVSARSQIGTAEVRGPSVSPPVLGHSASRAVHANGIDVLRPAIRADGIPRFHVKAPGGARGVHAQFARARLRVGLGVYKERNGHAYNNCYGGKQGGESAR